MRQERQQQQREAATAGVGRPIGERLCEKFVEQLRFDMRFREDSQPGGRAVRVEMGCRVCIRQGKVRCAKWFDKIATNGAVQGPVKKSRQQLQLWLTPPEAKDGR